MDIIYLFFEAADIRIPFYDYDRNLFVRLRGSGLGHWDHAVRQYVISRRNYNCAFLKKFFSSTPFVEVLKEPDNPVIVNGFFSDAGRTEDAADYTNEALPEPHAGPDVYFPAGELPKQFPESLREKLEAELRIRKYSPNTRAAYIHHNEALCQWLRESPHTVTADDIKRYLAFKEKYEGASSSSLNIALSSFKFFYSQVLKKDITAEQRRPRQDKRLPVVFSKSEIKQILDAEKNSKHRLLLMMVYASGLRVSEVVRLKYQDIDFKRRVIFINSGKGRKDRYTILSVMVITALAQYCSGGGNTWIFPGSRPDTSLSVRSAQHICEHALKKANIQKDASIHSLRHTFATHLLESGTDIRYIQELLGHASIRTTERYAHVARRTLLNITSPLDSINTEESAGPCRKRDKPF
ncbi:MAG: tyrosine-type recombinase/integrase [Treponema sp.]|nr:tyrosine-type recombinase/integrase [Treponema sp.]